MRSDASVVVLDSDANSRRPARPRTAGPHREVKLRSGPLLGIVVAHVAVVALVVATPGGRIPVVETERMVVALERPAVLVTDDPAILPIPRPRHRHSASAPSALLVADVDPPIFTTVGVGTMVPHRTGNAIDPAPFARRAGLQAGQGATVVLRVEILGSGEVGRVEVEVSGGSEVIDRAAIEFVRALTWEGGMVDGRPTALWVRQGVRLQG